MIIFQPISVVPIFFKSGKRSFTKFFILKNNSHWIYFNQFSANTTIILPLLRNRMGRIFTISTLWLTFCFIFLVSRNSWKKNTNWKQVWNIREIDFFMLRSRKWKTICSDQWSRWSHEFLLHPLQKKLVQMIWRIFSYLFLSKEKTLLSHQYHPSFCTFF